MIQCFQNISDYNKNLQAIDDMTKKQAIQLFEEKTVRTVWDDEKEKWYFSIVDVCEVLTDSKDPQAYWRKLKQRLKDEGNETVTNCHALKMKAADGKMRLFSKGVNDSSKVSTCSGKRLSTTSGKV